MKKYTIQIGAGESKGESATYRQPATLDKLYDPSPISTLYENFQFGSQSYPEKNCLGYRASLDGPYKWLSYKQVNIRLSAFGSGLLDLRSKVSPFGPSNHWHLGIYSVNRPEVRYYSYILRYLFKWVIAEQAANAYSIVNVALLCTCLLTCIDDTLGADTLTFCINHAELSIIVCSIDKVASLLKIAHLCPCLKAIISIDRIEGRESASVLKAWASEKNILLLSFEDVESVGTQKPWDHVPPKSTDIATICYTSGTTGNPKGALLMHKNFVASGLAISFHGTQIYSSDIMISYLPLAHCFERVLQVAMFKAGASIGFYTGDVLRLMDDVACLKPTIFPSVPRLFNRIYDKIIEATVKAPGFKGSLCRFAYDAKLQNMKNGGGLSHFLWDKLLFSKISALLGGRVRLMITGSAPIAGEVLNFLRIVFSCEILEGYGQTESAAGSTVTFPGDYVPSQVGSPLACNEIKLVDVPEMSYLSTDKPSPRGEICIRGHNVMKGYYKDDEKTKETIDEDGWLHTGDIGIITPHGCLAVIDRKKNIFKLAQGEYVAPEKLEVIFKDSQFVMQIFVHGDSLQSVLVAIIVPDPDKAAQWASKQLGKSATIEEICKNPDFKKLIMKELTHVGKKMKLAGYEIPKNVHLEPSQFTVENDLLTSTFKLKRNLALERYRQVFDQLYAELSKSKL